MRQVTWASLRVHARRYVAAAAAVVVAVGFVVVTAALSSATRDGMLSDVGREFTGADVVVSQVGDTREAEQVLARAWSQGADASVNALTYATARHDGRVVDRDVTVGSQSLVGKLRWQVLAEGEAASAPGEAVADVNAAEANGVSVGDRVVLEAAGGRVAVTITGLVESSSGRHAAAVYLTWTDHQRLAEATLVQNVVLHAPDAAGTVVESLRTALPEHLLVQHRAEYLTDLQAQITQGVDVVAAMLLMFAAIAVFVAVLVIANTFTVLLAQRRSDFALLRCVGATRKQVMRMVRAEALALGAGAATVGLGAGAVTGYGLVALAARMFPSAPLGEVTLSPLWLAGAWVLGVLMTLLASVLPARRSTRVSPLAALRATGEEPALSRAGGMRLAASLLLLLGGSVTLGVAIDRGSLPVMLVGGFVNFVGVLLLLGPVVVPVLLRLLGPVVSRGLGVPGRVAVLNARRNTRRTAASAASLLVGVTLITGVLVGMTTIRTVTSSELDAEHPIDAALTAPRPLDGATLERVRATDGVRDATTVPGTQVTVELGGRAVTDLVALAPSGDVAHVVHGSPEFLRPDREEVYLPWAVISDHEVPLDGEVTLRSGDREVTLQVRGGGGFGPTAVVAPAVLASLAGDAVAPHAVWALADGSHDAADTFAALETAGRPAGAEVTGGLPNRDWVDTQLDVVTGAAVALLGIAVVIALVGIASSLGLSVLERTREHALLRALGLTRAQMRATLAIEASILTLLAAVLGVAVGSAYAWVAIRTVAGEVIGEIRLDVPVAQLLGVTAAALVAGLLACVLPARKAARIAPAAGLAAD